jgi:hypothetical protein
MKTSLSILVLFFLSCSNAFAQQGLTRTNGPEGSDGMRQLAISSGGKVWLGGDDGLYYSNDYGATRTRVLPSYNYIRGLYTSADTIIVFCSPWTHAAYDTSYIAVSTSNGAQWDTIIPFYNDMFMSTLAFTHGKLYGYYANGTKNVLNIFTGNLYRQNIVPGHIEGQIATSNSNAVVLGRDSFTYAPHIFVSTDGLATTFQVPNPPQCTPIGVWIHDSTIYVYGPDPSSQNNFPESIGMISYNLGASYQQLKFGDSNDAVYGFANINDTLIATPTDKYFQTIDSVYLSIDDGTTWQAIYDTTLAKATYSFGTQIVGNTTEHLMMLGFDQPSYPTPVLSEYNMSTGVVTPRINSLYLTNADQLYSFDTTLYATCHRGIFKSANGGNSWTDISPKPLFNGTMTFLSKRADTLVMAGINSYYNCYSLNDGITWQTFPNTGASAGYCTNYIKGVLFNYTEFSTDFGATWDSSMCGNKYLYTGASFGTDSAMYIIDTAAGQYHLYEFNFNTSNWIDVGAITCDGAPATEQNFRPLTTFVKVHNLWMNASWVSGNVLTRYSHDGLTWYTIQAKGFGYDYISLGKPIWYNNVYLAIEANRNLAYSLDGSKWYRKNIASKPIGIQSTRSQQQTKWLFAKIACT